MLKISLLFKKNTNFTGFLTVRILTVKSGNLSGYYFYMNQNIYGDFQICISVPLINKTLHFNNSKTRTTMNAKISVFVIFFEVITYLLLYTEADLGLLQHLRWSSFG